VILYGALHCNDESGWLYRHLREQSPPREALRMLSVQILGVHQHGPLEAFVTFLDALGMAPGDFAIPDTRRLPPLVGDWFGLLQQQVLSRIDALVVFRDGAGEDARDAASRDRDGGPDPGELPQWSPLPQREGHDT
jgi:hypothetical protein